MPFGLRLSADILNTEACTASRDTHWEHFHDSLLHVGNRLPRTAFTSFLTHDCPEPLLVPARHVARPPTSFFDHGVDCNFNEMKKGEAVRYWWPGKAGKGECNNVLNRNRGCWYNAKLKEMAKCGDDEHCLAIEAQDKEPSYRLSCPSWIRNAEGERCNVPDGWEDCPQRFSLKRPPPPLTDDEIKKLEIRGVEPLKSVPGMFIFATDHPDNHCDAMFDTECLDGGFNPKIAKDREAIKQLGMYFNLGKNSWYQCTPWMRCVKYPIQEIYDPKLTGGKCGEETCREGDDCFVHEDPGLKTKTYKCQSQWNTFVINDQEPVFGKAKEIQSSSTLGMPSIPGIPGILGG